MIKVVSVAEIRQIEAEIDAHGIPYAELMQKAGRAIALRVIDFIHEAHIPPQEAKIAVFVGGGNNGGDGLVAARILKTEFHVAVRCYLTKARPAGDPLLDAVRQAKIEVTSASEDVQAQKLHDLLTASDIVIDAIYGIGIHLPLRAEGAQLLQNIHQSLVTADERTPPIFQMLDTPKTTKKRPYILAVDCPSGMDCDTGEADEHTIHADETMSFIAFKHGHFRFPAAERVGKLTFASLGVTTESSQLNDAPIQMVNDSYVRAGLPVRTVNGNKGTFGKLLVVGGSQSYSGAPLLAGSAGYHTGAGLVTLAVPESILPSLQGHLLEPTWISLRSPQGTVTADAMQAILTTVSTYQAGIIGPGLHQTDDTLEFIRAFLNHLAENNVSARLVIDADALNQMAKIEDWSSHLPQTTIITPHPGEMSRLTQLPVETIQQKRLAVASEYAKKWQVHVVLKGAHTVIANPDGQVMLSPFKTTALAKAGTGDALAGIIGGLLAQNVESFKAACIGVYLHGYAGTLAVEPPNHKRSILASDVIHTLGRVFRELE